MCMMASQVVMASAGGPNVRDQIKFLEEEPKVDIFGGVTEFIEDAGVSSVRTVRAAGVVVMVLVVLVAGICIMVSGGGQKKQESKARIVWIIVGAIIFFGGLSLVVWSGDIGAALYEAASATADVTPAVTPGG